jgi:ATP-dependent DNA helicase DinG
LSQLFSYLEENIDFSASDDNTRKNNSRYPQARRYRFPHGEIPEALQGQAKILAHLCLQLHDLLTDVADQLKQALDGYSEIPKHILEQWYPAVGLMQARAENQAALWSSYIQSNAVQSKPSKKPPLARWISLHDENGVLDFEVCSSPIQSAIDLEQSLWRRCFAAVVTSATLTALNSFERFQYSSGVAASANFVSIRSPFNFEQAIFSVPALSVEPSDTEGHTRDIIDFINTALDRDSGNLVLFSSRRQMEDVFSALDSAFQEQVLVQGDLSKQEMVSEHKKRIDAGKGSTLFGLASFSEGVDLPGVYCEHVVIAKLPFATPDDPVEEAMAEWVEKNGGNAFMQIAVPDAAMKLLQACGRLLRNEKDSGRITLLDKRIVTKRYGKIILDSLPPYKRNIEL